MNRRRSTILTAGLAVLLGATSIAHATSDTPQPATVSAPVQAPAQAAPRAPASSLSAFIPTPPVRVLDTRTGTGGTTTPIGPASQITLDLSTNLPADATAAVLNLTGTDPTANTFITAYPNDIQQPPTSTLNLTPRQTRANATTVLLNPARQINLYNAAGTTNLIADLAGYYTSGTGSLYNPLTPTRVLDTRNTAPIGPDGELTLDFSNRGSTATAVTFTLTGIDATTNTAITAYPDGTPRPNTSNLNLGPSEIVPNLITIALGSNHKVRLHNNAGNVNLIADLAGYYDPTQGSKYLPTMPVRTIDTRPNNGLTPGKLIIQSWKNPAPKAFTGNLTGLNSTTTATYVVTWPAPDHNLPTVSNLNLAPGQTAATMFIGMTGNDPDHGPSTYFANSAGYTDIIIDTTGYFV